MEIVKLRGYTSPSEMKGTETEKMQKSIDGVIKHDERKVVVKESIAVEETIRLCGPLEIFFEDGVSVRMNGEKPLFTEQIDGVVIIECVASADQHCGGSAILPHRIEEQGFRGG